MRLEKSGSVFVLHLDETENRFNPDWVAQYIALIDEVEAATGPKALVTAGTGKFFSNGLDLEWIIAHQSEAPALLDAVHEMFARVLSAALPTLAAIQGHAYAAGAMLATAHDYRVMREDRGFFCFPEVDIRIPFTRGMTALVSSKVSPQTATNAMVFGQRFGAPDALRAGLVDETVAAYEVLPAAIAQAERLAGKDSATVGAIKRGLYAETLAALRGADGNTLTESTFVTG
ncbi:putative enoyl-coa hydratase/isomerase family protein [Subtercola lobariae]|uniref:Enoyl-coa hydratase/isomerase family protein n=1 Tax=Subtercola lobariae TaxID=1588641 RepID=A0A917EWG5_9MICO|nr:putative enoyl-coa hydratase/isomerase family protein [Subtercola lobariae]